MSFRIRRLNKLRITPRTYFLDANVWLYFLQGEYLAVDKYGLNEYSKRYHARYWTFVNGLLQVEGARIGVSALLVSEIVNAFIRKFAMRSNLSRLGWTDSKIFMANPKYDYRDNPESNYDEMMRFVSGTLMNFCEADKLVFCDLGFSVTDQATYILQNFARMNRTDFNDYCFYEICAQKRWPLITDDEDMCFPDIEIYTLQDKLLRKAKEDQ